MVFVFVFSLQHHLAVSFSSSAVLTPADNKHGRPLATVVKNRTRDRTAQTYYLKNVVCWSSECGLTFTFEHHILFRNSCNINIYLIIAVWLFARTCQFGQTPTCSVDKSAGRKVIQVL